MGNNVYRGFVKEDECRKGSTDLPERRVSWAPQTTLLHLPSALQAQPAALRQQQQALLPNNDRPCHTTNF